MRSAALALLLLAAAGCASRPAPAGAGATSAPASDAAPPAEPGSVVAELQAEASTLRPFVDSAWVRSFLNATASLPSITPRTVYLDGDRTHAWSSAEFDGLSRRKQAKLTLRLLDERFYYTTRYGTPLAYARPLQILSGQGFSPIGRKILDFGYGGIGHLRLLATIGADVVGVEVDPLLRALYSDPSDQGPMGSRSGRLRLVDGRFPAEASSRNEVGSGYDLFLSKNVLKHGFIHPEQPVPERQRVVLGVPDEEFVRSLHDLLRPGGLCLIYNLSPAPNGPGQPYRPWADGQCPFPRDLLESAGFRVVAYDADDTPAAREMAHSLGWDQGDAAMHLETDLFAHYTLLKRAE